MGRDTAGVGINLAEGSRVVSLVAAKEDANILTICAQGYGKRTALSEYRLTRRGGKGVRSILCSERNGEVIASLSVPDDGQIMLMSRPGMVVRTKVADIGVMGRNTQGVRIINIADEDTLTAVATAVDDGEEDEALESTDGATPADGSAPDAPAEGEAAPGDQPEA